MPLRPPELHTLSVGPLVFQVCIVKRGSLKQLVQKDVGDACVKVSTCFMGMQLPGSVQRFP